jgi:hypothetical protein
MKVEKIRGLNLPGILRATSAFHGIQKEICLTMRHNYIQPSLQSNIYVFNLNVLYEVWSKTRVNAAAECDPTERQGS